MEFEDELTEMLVSSVEELRPPVAELVAAGGRQGRRRRRARRGLQVVGAAATVAAVVAGAVAFTGTGHGAGLAAADTAGPSPSASAGRGPDAGAVQSPAPGKDASTGPATQDITWQAMLKLLHDQLPPGAKFAALDPFAVKFNTSAHSRYAEFQYDDGAGASTVMLTVTDNATFLGMRTCDKWQGGTDEGPRKPGYEKAGCQVRQLPDGSTLLGYVTGTGSAGLYDEAVRLFRADGTGISITAANATLSYGAPITVTRDRPPVGLPGWEAIAQSPAWQFKVPQSVLDAGAAFAKDVSRLPCPAGEDPAKSCDIG